MMEEYASEELTVQVLSLIDWEGEIHPNHGYEDDKGNRIPYLSASYIAKMLPPRIPSHEYPDEEAELWIRKDKSDLDDSDMYFAWYFVNGKRDGMSDYGVHAATLADALALLTIELCQNAITKVRLIK